MALKGNRQIKSHRTDIYVDEVAERGGFLVQSTTYGSGAALDQASNVGTYKANSSGTHVLGVLLDDVVDVDQTRYKLNQHKSEIQKGMKATVADVGWVLTNYYVGSPTPGPAYLTSSGKVTPTNGGAAATPIVGRFESSPDEDSYVKVSFNLP
jgi:hypothetical protein